MGKYCVGDKILSPLWFQQCGGERPRRPRRSDASDTQGCICRGVGAWTPRENFWPPAAIKKARGGRLSMYLCISTVVDFNSQNFDPLMKFGKYSPADTCLSVYRQRPGLSSETVAWRLEQSAGQWDLCPVSVDLPSASENISVPDLVPWHYHQSPLNYPPCRKVETNNMLQIIEAHPNWTLYADVFEHPSPRFGYHNYVVICNRLSF